MTDADTSAFSVAFAPVGPAALAALADAVGRAQAGDPFARVVVIADDHDAARSVSHWLGAQGRGVVNVSVQTGQRLAAELAGADIKALPRLLEGPAVRLAAGGAVREREQPFEPAGERRFYRSLRDAFRRMAERPGIADGPNAGGPDADADAGGGMNAQAEVLYQRYRETVAGKGYCIPSELPRIAAGAVASGNAGRLPYVIYYLPRRLSAGDVELALALQGQGRALAVAGLTGDADADEPACLLAGRLTGGGVDAAAAADDAADPLRERAAVAGRLSIVAAPDPDEEARTVIRRIAADSTPFHRTAVIYRQNNPYDTLLRQELGFAGIPCAGAGHRTLADTPTGRLLLGIVDLAADSSNGAVNRERLIEWMSTTLVRWSEGRSAQGKSRPVPAGWINLAREARADGAPVQWQRRLNAHIDQLHNRDLERYGEPTSRLQHIKQSAGELVAFVTRLAESLRALVNPQSNWQTASENLENAFEAYRWYDTERDGESDDDRRKIDELVSGVGGLGQWQAEYDLGVLREAVREGLQAPVAERGRAVGAGVYLGPPAGIVGAAYDTVYVLGMVEGQFPPRPGISPWLADNPAERQREAALERYDFLASLAAAQNAVLSWPAATAERRAAYPSRWLVEAANLCHRAAGYAERLTYETITRDAGQKRWLTVIPSRVAGLRQLTEPAMQPADAADYRLMHLSAYPAQLEQRSDARMRRALEARAARYRHNLITEWDGYVPADIARIAGIGSQGDPVSPSALETWAACPYKYFLSRILGLSAPAEDEDEDSISALDKGSLVHKILERFVKEGKSGFEELRKLAEQEFKTAEGRGITGRHLLWEVTKGEILAGLREFLDAEVKWFGGSAPVESKAEVQFEKISVAVDGLGDVWFKGKIDRLDVLDDGEVRVRDFKTGRPDKYTSGNTAQNAATVANGQALQLPVYTAAARLTYPNAPVKASYSFPLASTPRNDGRPYDDEQDLPEFRTTLQRIVGTARAGVFPATPDGDGERSNCRYCDFKQLCPTRRRQIWERKGRHDPAVAPYNDLGGKAAI